MRRRLVLELDVGDAEPLECGGCPFRTLDYGAIWAESERVVYRCTCPQLYPGDECPDVSEGRTHACMEAEEEANAH